jgi:DNA-binding XRE family transcriptional regulator
MVIAVGQTSFVFSTMVIAVNHLAATNNNHGAESVRNSSEIVTETAADVRQPDNGGTMVIANVTAGHKNVSHGAIHGRPSAAGIHHGAVTMSNMPKGRAFNADAVRFGAILRQCREARGWTRVKLATRSGMAATYIGNLEQGGNVPTISTVLELAEVLGVDAGEIMRTLATARDPRRPATPEAEPPLTP